MSASNIKISDNFSKIFKMANTFQSRLGNIFQTRYRAIYVVGFSYIKECFMTCYSFKYNSYPCRFIPCIFIYLLGTVPCLFMFEYDLLTRRLQYKDSHGMESCTRFVENVTLDVEVAGYVSSSSQNKIFLAYKII